MDDRKEDNSQDRVNAGRGVAKEQAPDSNKNTTLNQGDNEDRPDERARKAGY